MNDMEKSVQPTDQEADTLSLYELRTRELCDKKKEVENKIPSMDVTEHQALADRVLNIMNITVERLQVALAIPFLLTDQGPINRLISLSQKNRLHKYCEKYLKESAVADFQDNEKYMMIDHELVKAIDLVYSNDELQKCIPKYVELLPDVSKKFLNSIKELKVLTEIRINTSANMEVEREKILHQVWHENKKMQDKIEHLKGQLHQKEVAMQWKIAEKQALVKKYKTDLANKKWNNNVMIQREVAAANERMQYISTKSEERQQTLQEEALKAQKEYEQLLRENMSADKKLREKKARILSQLKGWIKKYDNDIGERTREVELLTTELNNKTREFDEFMLEYDKQEEEYNAVIAMREAEERKSQQENLLLFMMNRAAKIIQLGWRRYCQKKKKKSKGKGKKGKK